MRKDIGKEAFPRAGNIRDALAVGGLGLAMLAAGCAEDLHLSAGSSLASWLDNPVQFPVTEQIHIHCSTEIAFDDGNALLLGGARITVTDGNVCSVVEGPTCTGKKCTATFSITDWGICMAKITAVTVQDGEEVSTCWYHAMFLGQDEMAAQQAAIQAELARCQDKL